MGRATRERIIVAARQPTGCPMPQPNDLSRSLAALDENSTLGAAICATPAISSRSRSRCRALHSRDAYIPEAHPFSKPFEKAHYTALLRNA